MKPGPSREFIDGLAATARSSPSDVSAWVRLAVALVDANRLPEAQQTLQTALQRHPKEPELLYTIAAFCQRQNNHGGAVSALKEILASSPSDNRARAAMASSLFRIQRYDEAEAEIEKGLTLDSENRDLLRTKGRILMARGDKKGSVAIYRKLVKIDPGQGSFHSNLASLGDDLQNEGRLLEICRLLESGGEAVTDRRALCAAAAVRCQALGKYDDAFAFYSEANQIRRDELAAMGSVYERSQTEEWFGRLMKSHPPGWAGSVLGASTSERPVFVVGMPRSGTTLVEQILDAHPQILGCGELPFIMIGAQRLREAAGYPEAPISREAAEGIVRSYLDYVGKLADPGTLRTVDKMPVNIENVGLIASLFPRARVIYCSRNPLDTCLSCFFQNFGARDLAYATNLEDLGHYYQHSAKLMQHWISVLPIQIHEVRYETLVDDIEAESRKLIEFTGLAWDDACLEFFNSGRAVSTASHMQVRRPIYKSSVDRWKNYEKHLGPLQGAIAPHPE